MPRRHTLTGRKEREQNRLLVNRARVRERQKRAQDWHREPIPDPKCSVCSKDITGFVFVCVQCAVSTCSACDARGHHAAHYVLRVPSGRPEKELRAVVGQVRKAIVSAGLSLNTAQEQAKDSEETHDETNDEEIEFKHSIKVEVEEVEDPLGSSEYDEPYQPAAHQAGGSQVVPEPATVKPEPSDPTREQTQSPSSSASSRRQSTASVDTDDTQPPPKKRRVTDENSSQSETFPKQASKTDKQPDNTISTTDSIADSGSPTDVSRIRLKKQ
ncbi:hypothetical protein ABMA28_010942 [Loxostege sticticalis]|uniref:B box-type domain-containing protein n=1 Tax=Loxostege sticticalis TaxID=481309 RepID=A0ABD0SA25_LOXSC